MKVMAVTDIIESIIKAEKEAEELVNHAQIIARRTEDKNLQEIEQLKLASAEELKKEIQEIYLNAVQNTAQTMPNSPEMTPNKTEKDAIKYIIEQFKKRYAT